MKCTCHSNAHAPHVDVFILSILPTYPFFTWLVGMHCVIVSNTRGDFALFTRGLLKVELWALAR